MLTGQSAAEKGQGSQSTSAGQLQAAREVVRATLQRRYQQRRHVLDAALWCLESALRCSDVDPDTARLWGESSRRLFARYDAFITAAHAEALAALGMERGRRGDARR